MMKKLQKYSIIGFWILVVYLFYHFGLLDIQHIQSMIEENEQYAILLFILLSSIRVLIFLPLLPFMIMGGLLFGGVQAFFYSMIGLLFSETIVYVFALTFSKTKFVQKLKRKYNHLLPFFERYNDKFLALGILAPFGATEIICFLSATTGIRYWKYIVTVMFVNIPTVLLYSLVGDSYNQSLGGILAMIGLWIFTIGLGSCIAYKMKKDMKKEGIEFPLFKNKRKKKASQEHVATDDEGDII